MARKELYFGLIKTSGFLLSKEPPIYVTIPTGYENLTPSKISSGLNGNEVHYFSTSNGRTSGIGKPVHKVNIELTNSSDAYKTNYNDGLYIASGKKFIDFEGNIATGKFDLSPTTRNDIGENDIASGINYAIDGIDINGTINNTYSYGRMPSSVDIISIDILEGYSGFKIDKNNSGRFIGIARYKDQMARLLSNTITNTEANRSYFSDILNKKYLLLDNNTNPSIKGAFKIPSAYMSNTAIIAYEGLKGITSNTTKYLYFLNGKTDVKNIVSDVTFDYGSNSETVSNTYKNLQPVLYEPLIFKDQFPKHIIVKHYVGNVVLINNVDITIKSNLTTIFKSHTFESNTDISIKINLPNDYLKSPWYRRLAEIPDGVSCKTNSDLMS